MTARADDSRADIHAAKALLKDAGYVVQTAGSYRKAQERQRIAEVRKRDADEYRESTYAWALDCCKNERYMRDRVTFVYGIARAHGATVEEFGGCTDHNPDMS